MSHERHSSSESEEKSRFNLVRWLKKVAVPALLHEIKDPDFPSLIGAVLVMTLMLGAAYNYKDDISEFVIGQGKAITYKALGLNTGPRYCYTLPIRVGPTVIGPEYPVKHTMITADGEPNIQNQAYISALNGMFDENVVCEGEPGYDRVDGKKIFIPLEESEAIPPSFMPEDGPQSSTVEP